MTRKVRWILSPDTFGENLVQLKEEIIRQGHDYIDIAKYFELRSEDIKNLGDQSQPSVFYGSIESGQHILSKSSLYPGVYCDLAKFKCSYYYPRMFGRYLLNVEHIFLPFGELVTNWRFIFDQFGVDDAVFMRPDTGNKLFIGSIFEKERFIRDVEALRCQPEDMVVIARPYDIDEEYRLVICDGQYITGSMYKLSGHLNKVGEECIPPEVVQLAYKTVQTFHPEPAYVIDIGMTYNGPKVIEFNSFSCSGLYWCNLEKIVREVSATVVKDWEDVYA